MQKTYTPKNLTDTSKLKEALKAGPDRQTLRNIMAYARALSVVHTKMTGQVNLLMN
jgi:hypothetical protein